VKVLIVYLVSVSLQYCLPPSNWGISKGVLESNRYFIQLLKLSDMETVL
jgi:hypothetical protein